MDKSEAISLLVIAEKAIQDFKAMYQSDSATLNLAQELVRKVADNI